MSDLISRDEALTALRDTLKSGGKSKGLRPVTFEMIWAIKSLPSAEPKTGKWILDPDGMDWNIPAWRCSECGFVATHIGVEPNGLGDNPLNWAGSKFCPQCGARITGYER